MENKTVVLNFEGTPFSVELTYEEETKECIKAINTSEVEDDLLLDLLKHCEGKSVYAIICTFKLMMPKIVAYWGKFYGIDIENEIDVLKVALN